MRAGVKTTWILLWALVAACRDPAARTEVIVEVVGDDGIVAAADTVVVEVFGGTAAGREQRYLREFDLAAPDVEWPIRVGVVPLENDPTRTFEVTAEARVGGTALARARVIGGFLEGQTLRFPLYLWDACRDVPCDLDETCDQLGLCVPATVDPCDFESLDGGRPRCDRDAGMGHDGGPDAGPVTGLDCTYHDLRRVDELNGPNIDCCASLSNDATTIYFATSRAGMPLGILGSDAFVPRRAVRSPGTASRIRFSIELLGASDLRRRTDALLRRNPDGDREGRTAFHAL